MTAIRHPSAAAVSAAIAEALPSSAPGTRRALLASADIQGVGVGEVIIHQGEDPSVVLIVAGHAARRRTTVDGRTFLTRILAPGDVVGLAALMYRPAAADLIALSAGAIARWSADDLYAQAGSDPGFAFDAFDHAVTAYDDLIERSDGLVHQDAVVRVARVLYRYRDLFFMSAPVLTRAHLPMLVGTSREMTGRVIRTLEARRIVERVGRVGLQLLDPADLEALGRVPADPSGGSTTTHARNLLRRARRPIATGAAGETTRLVQPRIDAGPTAVLEASPNPIVAVDATARITYVNPQAEVTFGYTREELLGRSVELLLPDRVSERHVAHRDGFIGHPVARPMGIGLDLAGRRKDGSEFPVEISLAPVGTGDGLQVYATVVDITARKDAEGQLLQAQKLESIGRLAGGIAHDFNNMLFAISGYAEMLEEDLSAPAEVPLDRDVTLRSVRAIAAAADRAATLTMQLLAFSRQQVVTPRVLDLGDTVRAIEPMLRPIIGETISLVLHLDPSAGRVRADPGQLDQILVNLVVNARDAMPTGGTITIETGNTHFDEPFAVEHFEVQPGPYVMLVVSDTGQGMDRATKEHLFEPFFTTKGLGKGTGLGLATIYGIVRQAGGHIWLYSEPGRGSTFKLYFPRDDAALTATLEAHPRASVATGRLLVVEDEPAVREMTTALLVRAGYSVVAVADGPEALALLPTLEPPIDVLITDVVMPGMSGLELAEQMLQLMPDLGVVLLSGYTAETLDPTHLTERGALFVSKPIASRELLDAIGRVMPVRRGV
jgi:two-component system, cell cycle sensor histidine kinase and response regulator CckA